MIRTLTLSSGACVGADGSATATARTTAPISAIIYSIYIDYQAASPRVGTVVTIQGAIAPKVPVLVYTGNADVWRHVMHPASSSADGAAIANQGALCAVCDYLEMVVTLANAGDVVAVTLLYEVV